MLECTQIVSLNPHFVNSVYMEIDKSPVFPPGFWEVIQIAITSLVGMFSVSAALEGYLMCRIPWYQRIMSAVGGLLLIYPGLVTDLIGLGLVSIVVVFQVIQKKKARSVV